MNRIEFIHRVAQQTMLPLHEVENAMNAIFANFKTILPEEEIRRISSYMDSDDLKSVWETANLPRNDDGDSG